MTAAGIVGAVIYLTIAAIVIVGVISAVSNGLVALLTRIDEHDERRAARDAKTFGEPTRRDVENAYGPLVLYGPSGEAYDGTVDLPRRGGVA